MPSQSHTALVSTFNSLITGLQKNLPNGSFLLGGTTLTTSEVVDFLQSIIEATAALQTARGEFLDASSELQALMIKYRPLIVDLKQTLQIQAGDSAALLSDYGITPRKPKGQRSPEVQVEASQKGALTRKARGTLGPKQKLKITGASASASSAQASAPGESGTGLSAQAGNPALQTSVKPGL